MQKTTTLIKLKLFFGKMLLFLVILAFAAGKLTAQPFINGNLSTGATSSNGTAAPAGYTWSEVQAGNINGGFGANITAGITIADDFTVPSGAGWSLSKFTTYAYSTGFSGSTSPFTDVRVQIFNTDPSVGNPTPVYGDLTTNKFTASSDALMFRIFNATPDQNRKVWKIEANISKVLGPGHYWIEWELGNGGLSNFSPSNTVVGTVTQPGNNATQHTLAANTWVALLDGANAQDMPFRLDYTVVPPPPCSGATAAVINSQNVKFNEGFNTSVVFPGDPTPPGWVHVNNSSPIGGTSFYSGVQAGVFGSNSGADYLAANFNNTTAGGTTSNWMISPVTSINNGDVFSFYSRTAAPSAGFPDRLQVRMSTNGSSTNVGTTATSTGDFGTLLLDINPTYTTAYPEVWTKFTVTVSGVPAGGTSGRVAFRYFIEPSSGTTGNYIGIDDAVYTSTSTPVVCSGSTGNIKVDITGGVGPFTVVYNAAPGGNVTVNNYNSGANIPVTPTVPTTYTLVSVTGFDGCAGAGLSGSASINTVTGSTAAVLSQPSVTLPPVQLINEQFDGTIPPAGWPIQNLSNPIGITNWFQNPIFPPQSGAGFAAANFNSAAGTGTISNWMFSPNITMKNGDIFTFWTRADGAFPDRLQLRQSVNGASVNAGATETSVGDFTTLLVDINPTLTTTGYPTAWTQYTITMSGLPALGVSGRLAFRYFVTNGGPAGANSDFIGIDNAVYTTFPATTPTTCTGSTTNLKVDITGGTGPYTVTITPTAPAGAPIVVTNYVSGANIPVTPAVSTTYALTSVVSSIGCNGTGNTGTPTITVSATTTPPLLIVDNPTGELCAGNPKLLTVTTAPTVNTFTAAGTVQIPAAPTTSGIANPYPSNLVVSGLATTGVAVQSVAINGFAHTFPTDVDIILQSPTGQNVVLMSDVAGTGAVTGRNYVFSDAAAAAMTAAAAPSGTYKPSNVGATDTWIAPGPGSITQASPALAGFTGDPNGTWKLFAVDDTGGDAGSITGWNIVFSSPSAAPVGYTFSWSPATGLSSTTGNPVAASPMQTTTYQVSGTAPNGCQTVAQITITVNQLPAVTTPPSNTTVCQNGTATFTAAFSGANAAPQWQVSTTGAGGPWTDLTNVAPYSGVTSGTLTISPVTFAMNGYQYRLKVSGQCPPFAVSANAVLTVNPAPVVTISPVSPVCGGIAGTNGTLLTASGATTYTWSPAAGLFTNAAATIPYVAGTPAASVYAAPTANTTYTVTGTNGTTGCTGSVTIDVNYKPVSPTVSPASVTMCLGNAAVPLNITSSLAPVKSTFTSGPISVLVPDVGDGAPGLATVAVSGIPTNAIISEVKVTFNMTHTYVGDVDINIQAPNGKNLNLVGGLDGGNYTNSSDNFTNTSFSSLGGATISGAPAPRTGTFKAEARALYGPDGYIQNTTTWASLFPTTASATGNWILGVGDWGAGDQGTITSFSIEFTYGVPSSGVWTPNGTIAAGLYTDPGATILYTGTPASTVYAKPPVSTTYSVTVTSIGPDAAATFSNPASITINDGTASLYPSPINVTGLPTAGASVNSVTITGLNHTWSDDVDILLQSPSGQNVVLMSDIGFADVLNNVNYTFNDAGPLLNATAAGPSGTYHPTNLVGTIGVEPDNWPAPGPGSFAQASPALSMFTGDMNGSWKLFVVDDGAGDVGFISGGYSINFRYPTPGCVSNATQVPVTVNLPITFNPALPADAAVCTDKVTSFTSAASGSVVNHNWKVSINNGNNWTAITNGGVYAGANTATLTITAPPVSMSGYLYKDSISTVACHDTSSRIARLTVNPLPTVVIAASPYQKLFPGLTTTLFSTVTPAAASYTWLKGGVAVPGANASSYLVTADGIGDYRLRVTDVNGCTNTSNQVSITDSVSGKVFVYPNPNTGVFQVRYYSIVNNTNLPRGLNIYDARGKRVATKGYSISAPYARMDVDMSNYGTGVYWLEVVDVAGNRLAVGRVEVIR